MKKSAYDKLVNNIANGMEDKKYEVIKEPYIEENSENIDEKIEEKHNEIKLDDKKEEKALEEKNEKEENLF